MTLTTNISS